MPKCEYWFMVLNAVDLLKGSDERLNKMGSEGWELVNMVPGQIAHQYEYLEGHVVGYETSVQEKRAVTDFVITYLTSFRRIIDLPPEVVPMLS